MNLNIKLFLLFVFRSFIRKPLRSFLTVLGAASGMALFFSIQIINFTAADSITKTVDSIMGETDLSIRSQEGFFHEEMIDKIEQIQGVKYATGIITEKTFFYQNGVSKKKINILAVDLLKEGPFRSYEGSGDDDGDIIDDPMEFLNTPNGIIISEKFSINHDLPIEGMFELLTTQGRKTFEVGGVIKDSGIAKAFGGSIAIMDLMAAQYIFGQDSKVNRVDVIIKNKSDLIQIKTKIKEYLGANYKVESPAQQAGQIKQLTSVFRAMLDFIGYLTWLIGLFVVFSSVHLSVEQKQKEIGILRALGSDKSLVTSLFLMETAMIGLISAIVAIGLGHLLAYLMIEQIFVAYEAQFKLTLGRSLTELPVKYYIMTIVGGIITCLVAGFIPAHKASKVDPLKTINNEALDLAVKTFVFPLRSFVIGNLLLFYFLYSFSNQLYLDSFVLNAIQLIAGLSMLFILLKPYTWILLELLSKMSGKRLPVLWLAIGSLKANSKKTNQNIQRLFSCLLFVYFLYIVSNSIVIGISQFFESKATFNQQIMSDGDIFNMDIVPISYKPLAGILDIPGIIGTKSGMLHGLKYKKILKYNHSLDVHCTNEMPDINTFKKNTNIKKLANDFDFDRFFKHDSREIVISSGLVKLKSFKIRDIINLQAGNRKMKLKIVGTFLDYTNPNGIIYMNCAQFTELYEEEKYMVFNYNIQDGFNKEEVNRAVEEYLTKTKGICRIRFSELSKQFRSKITSSFEFFDIIALMGAFVTFLGLVVPLIFHTMVRKKEFGILRSAGLSMFGVSRLLIIESSILMIISLIFVFSIGTLFLNIFYEVNFLSQIPWDIPMLIDKESIRKLILLAFGINVLSILIPILMIKKNTIQEMISYE